MEITFSTQSPVTAYFMMAHDVADDVAGAVAGKATAKGMKPVVQPDLATVMHTDRTGGLLLCCQPYLQQK